jgi:hypothetical protein
MTASFAALPRAIWIAHTRRLPIMKIRKRRAAGISERFNFAPQAGVFGTRKLELSFIKSPRGRVAGAQRPSALGWPGDQAMEFIKRALEGFAAVQFDVELENLNQLDRFRPRASSGSRGRKPTLYAAFSSILRVRP